MSEQTVLIAHVFLIFSGHRRPLLHLCLRFCPGGLHCAVTIVHQCAGRASCCEPACTASHSQSNPKGTHMGIFKWLLLLTWVTRNKTGPLWWCLWLCLLPHIKKVRKEESTHCLGQGAGDNSCSSAHYSFFSPLLALFSLPPILPFPSAATKPFKDQSHHWPWVCTMFLLQHWLWASWHVLKTIIRICLITVPNAVF